MTDSLPCIGAALTLAHLPHYRDWLIEGQRDLEIQDFIDTALLDGDWRGRVAAIREQLDGFEGRLGLHGPFWNLPLAAHDPDIRAVVQKRLGQGLDAAAALGAMQMVVHSPFTTWDAHNLDMRPGARERLMDNAHATLRPVVARAETIGCQLVIENIEDRDPLDRVRLAASFNSSAVAVSIDTGHAHYAHVTTGAPPVDYYVRLAGKALAHIHLQDADGYADRHWAPGLGTVNWPGVFSALAQTGATPNLVLELADASEVSRSAEWLMAQGLVR